MESSLKKRYFFKLFSSVVNGLLGLVTVAMVPRVLGPSNYGIFVYLTTFFSNIISFFDVGTSTAFYTKLSKRPNEKTIIGFYFVFIVLIFAICLFFLVLSLTPWLKSSIYSSYDYFFIFEAFLFSFLTWLSYIAIKISDAYALTVGVEVLKVIHRVVFFLALVLLVFLSYFNLQGFFLYQLALLGSFIFILIVYFYKKNIFTSGIFT